MEYSKKDRILKRKLLLLYGEKIVCPECGTSHKPKEVWRKKILSWIKKCKENSYQHPLDQINDKSELAYITCFTCEKSVDMRKPYFCNRYHLSG